MGKKLMRQVNKWQGLYSTAQVSRLARIPTSTLYSWKTKEILKPSVVIKDGDTVIDYGYSYADLTIARLMRALRDEKLNLKSVGIALHHLFDRLGPPSKGWADAYVYIVGNKVFAEKREADEWGMTTATSYGQRADTRLFGDLFEALRNMEEGGSILIPQAFSTAIDIDPSIMDGAPVIKNTRIPTHTMFIKYLAGKTTEQLAKLYGLAKQLIEKVIEYERFLNTPITETRTTAA
jgi:uncharacterized protein (DUF433 family)/DNA-binding transcriptional MerR regulator